MLLSHGKQGTWNIFWRKKILRQGVRVVAEAGDEKAGYINIFP